MNNNVIKAITRNGLVAAIYFLLTFLLGAISYRDIQVGISEVLLLLCFFRRDYVIGLSIGCFFANMVGDMGIIDAVFGTLATFVSGLIISYMKNLFVATLFPVIINAFVVGAELYFLLDLPFWYNVLFVGIGEFIAVSILGYAIFMLIGKRKSFHEIIMAKQNFNFKW